MMKRRMLRCLMSVLLIVVLCVTSISSANAADSDLKGTEKVNLVARELICEDEELKAQEDKLYKELEILEEVGLETEFINATEHNVEDIVYVYELSEGIVNKVTVDSSDTEIVLNIRENSICNEVRIDDDGAMYVDGIRVVEDDLNTDVTLLNNKISPYSGEVMNWITSTCPYGTKSSYTYLLGTKKDADITLTNAISNLATSVVVAIICSKLGVSAVLSTGIGVVVAWIKDRNPSTRGLSYKATNYAHKNYTNTYITPISKYAYRSDFTWYTLKNYGGSTYKETMYYMKQIG